eukprot:TRINITY_DN20592_c0_g1_i1.p1 TRINITY_DN20592_c0_g1~~TRINITY_DN20592_c0_g1_i1.p1  ORF type:complete len:149 (-),score=38.78 TRINITY_DN20592_c0_g1_i1:61-483(-)
MGTVRREVTKERHLKRELKENCEELGEFFGIIKNQKHRDCESSRSNHVVTVPTWISRCRLGWCENVNRIRFVHNRAGKCYLLLQSESEQRMNQTDENRNEDSPPAYSAATADEIVTDATFSRNSLAETDGNLLDPGFIPL